MTSPTQVALHWNCVKESTGNQAFVAMNGGASVKITPTPLNPNCVQDLAQVNPALLAPSSTPVTTYSTGFSQGGLTPANDYTLRRSQGTICETSGPADSPPVTVRPVVPPPPPAPPPAKPGCDEACQKAIPGGLSEGRRGIQTDVGRGRRIRQGDAVRPTCRSRLEPRRGESRRVLASPFVIPSQVKLNQRVGSQFVNIPGKTTHRRLVSRCRRGTRHATTTMKRAKFWRVFLRTRLLFGAVGRPTRI